MMRRKKESLFRRNEISIFGFMKGDEWRGGWGQRRRRGQGNEGRGLNEEGIATAPRQSCKDLRSKRYISDGFCTSKRPLIEAVCAEKCCGPTPAPNRHRPRNRHHKYRSHHSASPVSLHRSASNHHLQPWYADYVKVWAQGKNEMNSVISASVAASDDAAEDEDKEDGVEEEGEDGGDAVEWRCVEDAVRRRRVRLICRDGTRRTYHVKLVKSCKCVQRRRQRRRRRGRRKGRRRLGRIGSWASRRMGREAD
ncbi:hypothetical protein J437_LFUL009849 [Ladona fulva]|uniref:Uncharacterized protein n=1 Tax=Ladona fulva TaxID=123851 RepID=A0A8K0P021_LADFU|nr:hypothetical protein J437_LFUL009849 [Ladona fulva]